MPDRTDFVSEMVERLSRNIWLPLIRNLMDGDRSASYLAAHEAALELIAPFVQEHQDKIDRIPELAELDSSQRAALITDKLMEHSRSTALMSFGRGDSIAMGAADAMLTIQKKSETLAAEEAAKKATDTYLAKIMNTKGPGMAL